MNDATKAFANRGLDAIIEKHCPFEFQCEDGSKHRLTWVADWESETIEFEVYPLDFNALIPSLKWTAHLHEAFRIDWYRCNILGTHDLAGTFVRAYPDGAARAPYVYRGIPTPGRL
jgi:hypothetical protein